jgi:hypothetical protein
MQREGDWIGKLVLGIVYTLRQLLRDDDQMMEVATHMQAGVGKAGSCAL